MGIHEAPTPQHWNYFLALEDDVFRLSRFIEFTQANYAAYSLELARVLFSAAAEVDVVAKQLCAKIDKTKKADNITKYRKIIQLAFPVLKDAVVFVPRFGLTLTPWEQWGNDANPLWWAAYNNVKHQRHEHFADASLKNALNAVAGLFVLLLFFYGDERQNGGLTPDPVLFRAGAPFQTDYPAWGRQVTLYQLGDHV